MHLASYLCRYSYLLLHRLAAAAAAAAAAIAAIGNLC